MNAGSAANQCEQCQRGKYDVYTTRTDWITRKRTQYLICNHCNHTRKRVISLPDGEQRMHFFAAIAF